MTKNWKSALCMVPFSLIVGVFFGNQLLLNVVLTLITTVLCATVVFPLIDRLFKV